jgi:hypothetical protein
MLTDLIAKHEYICATADIWSANNQNYMGIHYFLVLMHIINIDYFIINYETFIGMTCHFIDEETYFRQSYVIGCIRIKGSHNYQNITEVYKNKLQKRKKLIYQK